MTEPAVVQHHSSAPPPESGRVRREVAVIVIAPRPPLHLAFGRALGDAAGVATQVVVCTEESIPLHRVTAMLGVPKDALDGVILRVEVGDPTERVLAYANEHPSAALVVAGGDLDVEPFGLAPAASRLLTESAAPIFVVRDAAPPRITRILVPLDGTPSTAAALGPAVELARAVGASLDILLIGHAGQLASEPGAMGPPHYVDQPQHEWAEFTHEFLDRFIGGIAHVPPEVAARLYIGTGEPAAEIHRFEETLHPDLLVLVWHGDSTGDHGGVFQRVLRAARCPTLVLRR